MGKKSVFYFGAAVAFAAISIVCSKEWTLDSHVKDKQNGIVNNFHIHKVSILDALLR